MLLNIPPKFSYCIKIFKGKPIQYLDIGCGNKSYEYTRRILPNVKYFGLDLTINEEDKSGLKSGDELIEMDLNTDSGDRIPDSFFDYGQMTHVIEHLNNGEQVLDMLLKKIKPGGHFYLEYPWYGSVNFPSKQGTLNFFDDPTHVRVYDIVTLINIFIKNGFVVKKAGRRRAFKRIVLFPALYLYYKITAKPNIAGIFWDLYGFPEFILARKINKHYEN
jgi:SAM-dependent methyltransferase